MSSKKKVHPADAAALAGIEQAVSFSVYMLTGNDGWQDVANGIPTLAEARAKAIELGAGASRTPGVYAITADGKAHLVPPGYQPGAVPVAADEKPAKPAPAAKPKAAAKPKVAAKPKAAAKPKKAAKPKAAKRPAGNSKTDIAIKLLTRPGGATRKQVTEATDWPSINLKPIAKRHKMKLTEKDGILRMVEA